MVDYRSLLGRRWQYGVNDCYSLLRDFYKCMGVELPDFPRPACLDKSHSIFLRHAKEIGFYQTSFSDKRFGDVFIMNLGTDHPNHAGIYVGDMRMIHQRQDSLSAETGLASYYIESIAAVFRYGANRSAT
jgi:cell wall-associated NlpC family hydrolase